MNTWSHIHVDCHQMVPLRVCSNGPYDGGRGCFNTLVLLTVDRAAMNKWSHIHVNCHKASKVVHLTVDQAGYVHDGPLLVDKAGCVIKQWAL